VGKPAPDFDVPSTKNIQKLDQPVKLSDYHGKWVVLLFYPLDFTFVCPTELTTFSDRYEDFEGVGAEVIGISTDSAFSHRAWLQTPRDKGGVEGLRFPLGADITKKMSKDYGVLIEDRGIALRGLFVIDPEGVLRYKVVRSEHRTLSRETLRVIQAFANWRSLPGGMATGSGNNQGVTLSSVTPLCLRVNDLFHHRQGTETERDSIMPMRIGTPCLRWKAQPNG
jgi:peroxiredoxin (alkyl hydroperoxide reductase subunit C)